MLEFHLPLQLRDRGSHRVHFGCPGAKLSPKNRVAPVAAVAAAAAGTVLVRNKINQTRQEWEAAAAKAEREAAEAAERYNRLQDAYAGRTSLMDMEAAVKAYGERR